MLGPWELVADDGTVAPVTVPGTVTQAFTDRLDERAWVFRTTVVSVPDDPELAVDGVATSYDVVVDGVPVASGVSMYTRHRIPVEVRVGSTVEIRCHPLATALPQPRPPRARWRTRLVDDGDLRLVRTTLLGRCPGIAPGPPVVGPWRPVTLRSRGEPLGLRTRLDGTTGVLTSTSSRTLTCAGVSGVGELRIPDVAVWWPHSHGEPVLHDVTIDGKVVARVGFRSVANTDPGSLALEVNGVPVWARGAVWTPPGLLAGVPEDPRATVQLAVDAGMNLLRVPGLAPYEDGRFFEVCDELGVLVWHDLALANLDVPHDLLDLDSEVQLLLDTAGGHPSLAVVCGGSETAQQVSMLGLDPTLWESDFLLRRAPEAVGGQAVWIANSPLGGALPFRVGEGIAHWFGVGGYRRPLSDARTTDVRFAAECLAFANRSSKGDWVPRDSGASWDFADVVDHYAADLGIPRDEVVGVLMTQVFGNWRRAASRNTGGLVLWLRDLQPGHGWGVLEADGTPKPPYHALAKILAPQAIWLTDEGLDGVHVHLANDRPTPWTADLTVTLHNPQGAVVESCQQGLTVEAHGAWTADVEGLLGRFVDASYAYRFGEPQVDSVTAAFGGATATWTRLCT